MQRCKKYNCCHKCNENGDGEQSCIEKYKLELRLKDEYKKCGLYKLDTELKDTLLHNCNEIKQIITDNGNIISYNMLMDIYNFHIFRELQDQKEIEKKIKNNFMTFVIKLKKNLIEFNLT